MRSAAIGLGCLMAMCAPAAAAQVPLQTPFETPLPWSLPQGGWEAAAGVSFSSGEHPPFFAEEPATERDRWALDLVDLSRGLGAGCEARLQFGAQHVEEEDGEPLWGIQDARLSFAYQIPGAIAAALTMEVKLPNAGDEDRLGTDQTDVTMAASGGHQADRWGWAARAGLGLLGNPLQAAAQDDVLVFGVAAWRRMAPGPPQRGWLVTGEVYGMAASRFGNDFRYARAGVLLGAAFPVSVTLSRGLTSESGDWGVDLSVTLLHSNLPR